MTANSTDTLEYADQLCQLFDAADRNLSNIKPSDWCEQNRFMTSDVSPIEGYFSYDNSPYLREVVDCLSPDHPAHTVAVMKGAQIGFSSGVIEAGIGWIISECPGNILFLVGHEDLVKDAGDKVDRMIDNSGIRHLIRSQTKRAKSNKTGDTNTLKQYPGGYAKIGIANHKMLRNISMRYGFIDDYESMKGASKESGSTEDLVRQRFAAFKTKKKLFFISTPEVDETSNIKPVYEKGDKRKYHIPAPCCGEMITIEWSIPSKVNPKENAGIVWDLDDNGELIADSVGYVCQECGGFFTDRDKAELLRRGDWIPTAKPSQPGYYSYHISALYAPPYMFGWLEYVRQYLDADPPGGELDPGKYQTFKNLVLGETYVASREELSVHKLQKNSINYEIGIVPERVSTNHGNGKIVMLTCGIDLNGKEDDARLDYEIIAHAENQATYSIDHGSLGTFKRGIKSTDGREVFTYRHGAKNSVWPLLEEIINKRYEKDSDGADMPIYMTGVDCGFHTIYAKQFVDKMDSSFVVGLAGRPTKLINPNTNTPMFRRSPSDAKLFYVESNLTKDRLAKAMNLSWETGAAKEQPAGFMNFPYSKDGKYAYTSYFSHFAAEHKTINKNGHFVWEKKKDKAANHMFDCRLYAQVCVDIFLADFFKNHRIKNGTWNDFVKFMLPS